ncbi:Zinc finger domain containing protein [Entamoeba marina]
MSGLLLLFLVSIHARVDLLKTDLTQYQPFSGIWVKPDDEKVMKMVFSLSEPVGSFYFTSITAVYKNSTIVTKGKLFLRNGFYLDQPTQAHNVTCFDDLCSIDNKTLSLILNGTILFMTIGNDELNLVGKPYKGKTNYFTTYAYIIILFFLLLIEIYYVHSTPIHGIAHHVLVMGDAYVMFIYATTALVFSITSVLFYLHVLIVIESVILVALQGSKYLGKYGIYGQLVMTAVLLCGFLFAQYYRRCFILSIVSPFLFGQLPSKRNLLRISLVVRLFVALYWLLFAWNPINVEIDPWLALVVTILIVIQFIRNPKQSLQHSDNKTQHQVIHYPVECPICMENVEEIDSLITPCSHVFHKSCIELWFNKSLECPMCRKSLESFEF